jgi:hypothetical protein
MRRALGWPCACGLAVRRGYGSGFRADVAARRIFDDAEFFAGLARDGPARPRGAVLEIGQKGSRKHRAETDCPYDDTRIATGTDFRDVALSGDWDRSDSQ